MHSKEAGVCVWVHPIAAVHHLETDIDLRMLVSEVLHSSGLSFVTWIYLEAVLFWRKALSPQRPEGAHIFSFKERVVAASSFCYYHPLSAPVQLPVRSSAD